MKLVSIFLLAMLLAGCATTPLQTPSGHPQVFVPAVTIKEVQNVLIDAAVTKGFHIQKQTRNLLVLDHPLNGFGATVMLGSEYDPTPDGRIVFSFAALNGGTEVFARGQYVTNPGSPYEQITPDHGGARGIQAMLERMKSKLEKHTAEHG